MSDLGGAQGRISIDTAQLAQARAAVQAFAHGTNTALAGMNPAIQQAQQNLVKLSATAAGINSPAQINAARSAVRAFAQQTNTAFTGVAGSTQNANKNMQQLTSTVRGLAGAFGIQLGVQAIAQFVQLAVASTEAATAFERQKFAATQLAGSTTQLNQLLAAYNAATGNAISKAQAMYDVTRLQAIGFADSAQELDQFARAARGISLATGQNQDYIITQLQLAIANQSKLRLDQLGLGVTEVQKRIDSLKESNSSLSDEMAYQQAVLGAANDKFGDLTKSAVAQVSGIENMRKAWEDLRLELGKALQAPAGSIGNYITQRLNEVEDAINDGRQAYADSTSGTIPGGLPFSTNIEGARGTRDMLQREYDYLVDQVKSGGEKAADVAPRMEELADSIRKASITFAGLSAQRMIGMGYFPQSESRSEDDWTPTVDNEPQVDIIKRDKAILEWAKGVQRIEENANAQRLAAVMQYEASRSSAIQRYNLNIQREAEDFGLSRLRQERNFAKQMLDAREEYAEGEIDRSTELLRDIARANRDNAKRLADMREEYERTSQQRSVDSAERLEEWRSDHAEQVNDATRESAERLAEIETDYQAQRARSMRDSQDRITDAAASLDAKAVYLEQRQAARTAQDQVEARDKAIEKEKEKLTEQLNNFEKSLNKRLEDDAKAQAKSNTQAKEAYDRQVEKENEAHQQRIDDSVESYRLERIEQLAAYNERIEDMKTDFETQKEEEDIDRGIRLERMEADHVLQLGEMQKAHNARMVQIGENAEDERRKLDEIFQEKLEEAGLQTDAWIAKNNEVMEAAKTAFNTWWETVTGIIKKDTPTAPGTQIPDKGVDNTPPTDAERALSEYEILKKEGERYNNDGSLAWQEWNSRLLRKEDELRALGLLGGGGAGASSMAAAYTAPSVPARMASAASGVGGGSSGAPSISMSIYGAPGQSEEALGEIVERRLYNVLQRLK